jgi:hypothetical protein
MHLNFALSDGNAIVLQDSVGKSTTTMKDMKS